MDRRSFVVAAPALLTAPSRRAQPAILRRPIPRTGELLPAVGMGTWLTFDVGAAPAERAQRRRVLEAFFAAGGGMIDSSPMYGRAERVVGDLLKQVPHAGKLFAATKIWTAFDRVGRTQMDESLRLWGLARFDLQQIHNLLNWRGHIKSLREWKAEGRVRYVGITTSHGRAHDELEDILKREPFDFVQFTYSLADRSVEQRLLPLAAERGIAVIANRPFDGGALLDRLQGKQLPSWAREIDCDNWPQFCLKWIVAHPAVTCAIPATSNPAHMAENMGALRGRLPDAGMRRRMLEHVERA
ncbi:MAG: aldo/keto reductase [Pseudomonadota bacterium]